MGELATVLDLKSEIYYSSGIPVDTQRLIYNGLQLRDDRALADYNIHDGSLVYLAIRLRGC